MLPWNSNKYYVFGVCVCSLRYPASNAHAPYLYCHLWDAGLYNIFAHFPINGMILEKKVTEHKIRVLRFSTTFIRNISLSKENSARYYLNPLAPNDVYIRRTAQLTSRRCILNIYSTNILTEYFKHAAQSPFFFLFKMPFIS